jgi:RNA:NAD 2'-phosphotransferase (TPT1/KptA family)
MNWWKTIKLAGKTVYHGTSINNVPDIQQNGLMPSVGRFTSDAYKETKQLV